MFRFIPNLSRPDEGNYTYPLLAPVFILISLFIWALPEDEIKNVKNVINEILDNKKN